jgi:hypothetical protein
MNFRNTGDIFFFMGMYYSGLSKGATPIGSLLLLVPSVAISAFVLDFDNNVRKTIAFVYPDNMFWHYFLIYL